jgi:hypothetical protein
VIWKIITLLGAAFALWSFARRALGAAGPPARRPDAPRSGGAEDYERCARCGAWKPVGGDCACRLPPTP